MRLGRSLELLATALNWLGDKIDALVFLGDLAQAALHEDCDCLFAHVAATMLLRTLPDRVIISPTTGVGLGTVTLASWNLDAAADSYRWPSTDTHRAPTRWCGCRIFPR